MRLLRRRSTACACCAASPVIGKLTACPRPLRQSLGENTDWLRARSTAASCHHWMVGGHPPTRAMHRSWNCAPALPHLVVRDQHFSGRNGSVAPAKTQARPLNEAALSAAYLNRGMTSLHRSSSARITCACGIRLPGLSSARMPSRPSSSRTSCSRSITRSGVPTIMRSRSTSS